eukprot:TRINITY_DN12930_c0_g1_i1.p1 TRINITY_DN12930_c0_g1~~TRINITY_DN12930_c0_g1_i1.p1  ORF type:complete len:459 (+),score=107.08 TRINITY_DN12930_c0_g1_i1:48-1424(+)
MYKSIICLLVVAVVVNNCLAVVQVSGRTLLVDGAPFLMKGVGYNPIPIGLTPDQKNDYYTSSAVDVAVWQRDVQLLKNMGCNTVRLYGWDNSRNHTQFLDALLQNGIRVVLQYWFSSSNDISNTQIRTNLINGFTSMVNSYKYHPAIIMWLFGNELNAPWNYQNKLTDLFSLLDAATQAAHQAEGTNYRPVSSPFADINLSTQIQQYSNPQIDVWTVQVYRGKTFGNLFQFFKNDVTAKPMFITEFGIDAYDNDKQAEDQAVHSEYITALWGEIVANTDACSGGCVFAYSDEWWKGRESSVTTGCPESNAAYQSNCGGSAGAFPDKFGNEEWFGLHAIDKGANTNDPDILTPRAAAVALGQLWKINVPLAPVAVTPRPPTSVTTPASTPSLTPSLTPSTQDSLLAPNSSTVDSGAIAGIVVGVLVGTAGLIMLVLYLIPQARARAYPWTKKSTTVNVS